MTAAIRMFFVLILFPCSFIYRPVFIWAGGELDQEKYLYLKERRSDDLFNPGNNLVS